MKKYAVINAEGETIITGNDAQELKAMLTKSIEDLKADAIKLLRVSEGKRASYRGISDPIEAEVVAFMLMMNATNQQESWTVKEV